jgi:hypothetical protein
MARGPFAMRKAPAEFPLPKVFFALPAAAACDPALAGLPTAPG